MKSNALQKGSTYSNELQHTTLDKNGVNSMDKIAKVKKNLQLQQWAQMVTERQSAGMSVAQWCEHEKISKSVYYYRLRKVRENICEQTAVSVAEIPASANGSVMTISCGEMTVEIGNAVSVEVITAVIEALKC